MHVFVAKLLSIAVMTYSYVYHLQNLCPANLLHTSHTVNELQHAIAARLHDE